MLPFLLNVITKVQAFLFLRLKNKEEVAHQLATAAFFSVAHHSTMMWKQGEHMLTLAMCLGLRVSE